MHVLGTNSTALPAMLLAKRLVYASFFLIAVTMAVVLASAIAEGLGASVIGSVQAFVLHPAYQLIVLGLGFTIAPSLSARMPIAGDASSPSRPAKQRIGYDFRLLLWSLLAFLLVVLAYLEVYLLSRLS